MRSPTLLALFLCIVFVSSAFRTAFGQDDSQVEEEEKHVASKSDEGSGEAPSGSQEPPGNHQTSSGEQELSEKLQDDGNHQAASGEEEKSGKLQAGPDGQSRNELLASGEDGEFGADRRSADVESIANEPAAEENPDTARSGNLDINYGKQSLYTVAGKNCVCRSCSCRFSVRVKNMIGLMGRKIWGNFSRQRK
jgi:hypothetical protein